MPLVLVTGGGGYIGSVLLEMLLEQGYSVRVLDRFFFGQDTLRHLRNQPGLDLLKGDIRWVGQEAFQNVDAVIDLAALSNDPAGDLDPVKTIDINYLGRNRIAHLAIMAGVRRYILASSCSVYGCQEEILHEESPVDALTTYAQANYLAEKAVLNLSSPVFAVSVLRQATVYGLSYRMRFDLAVNSMAKWLFNRRALVVTGDGSQWRPFVHVRDTCRAFITVLESEPALVNGEVFNVGSNEQNIKIMDLARLVAGLVDAPVEITRYGEADPRSYRVNFDKIAARLGYQAKVSLAEGAREVLAALEKGIEFDYERCMTVSWYSRLLTWKKQLDQVLMQGEVL